MGNLEIAAAMPNDGDEEPGDPGSLEALFAAQETPLLIYAGKLIRDPELAQDIVQEAFMKLHVHFEDVRQPRPWLYRTVHNLALNHRRAGQKIIPLEPECSETRAVEPADLAPLPNEQVERMEAVERTQLCLDAMDQRSKELIRMKFEEELSYKEISARTGLSVSNVGYILHHALKSLASTLAKSGIQL